MGSRDGTGDISEAQGYAIVPVLARAVAGCLNRNSVEGNRQSSSHSEDA
jgi:hypothetical protein